MKSFSPTLDEILAIIIVIGCLCLIALDIDTEIKSILGMAAAWVFGREYTKRQQGG